MTIRYTPEGKVYAMRKPVDIVDELCDALDAANEDRTRLRSALRGLFASKANCAYSVRATKAERAARPAAWVAAYAALDGSEVRGAAAPSSERDASNPNDFQGDVETHQTPLVSDP